MNPRRRLLGILVLVALTLALTSFSATAAPTGSVHSIWSHQPFTLKDNGVWLTPTRGNAIVSWTTDPLSSGDSAFFNAIVYAGSTKYEFRLKSVASTSDFEIDGIFDIYKNSILVAPSLPGKVYGLDQPAGNHYFKFYDSAEQWNVSAFINSRFDY